MSQDIFKNFKYSFDCTRKFFEKYSIENLEDIENAAIVGIGRYKLEDKKFDYELLLDKIIELNSIINNDEVTIKGIKCKNNPYVSKVDEIINDSKRKKEIATKLLKFVKIYGIPQTENKINIKKLVERIHFTSAINEQIEEIKYDLPEKNNVKKFEIDNFVARLGNITYLVYGSIKDNPIFPKLQYNDVSGKIEICFASQSIITILNYRLFMECTKMDSYYNVCEVCKEVFPTNKAKLKVCSKECEKKRKTEYQRRYRKKKHNEKIKNNIKKKN